MNLETLRVTHWTLPVKKAQVRAVHLSDLHLDDRTSIEWLQFLMRRIAAEQPDLILFSGDFTATRAPYRNPQPVLDLFAALDAPMGKFAVRGNHDRRGAAGKAADLMKQAGFRVLENEAVELQTPSGEPVIVGGLAPMEKKEYDDCFKLYSALPDALRKEMDKIAEASAASMCRDLSADSSGDYLDVRASAALRLKVSVTDGSREIEYTIEF